ncbi:LIM domain containing protein [Cordyceps fumosorosea ARSEF 2679]|uniref:LIM domain containing protein n=1 Tax=Cordyceps fumosorosea (strain ARSEF 2679) TaxID=1081104 RepID=A0A167QIQ9_CORFA|nr:LIM domain containing protein [Cordyceps fumosorosea ARSEF 2679]OAA57676.1 LIM domain containing protein [Cordyceps fumosorosea ARSEF 2679]
MLPGRYRSQGQITPISYASSSRETSPKTPTRRSGINRSFNDDYAPRIANSDDGQLSSRGYGPRPGGYGGFGNQTPESESNETVEPPQKETSATSVLQRMAEFAGGYGGFGARPAKLPAEPEKPVEVQPKPEPEPQAEPEVSKDAPGFLERINGLAGAAFAGAAFDAGRRPSAPKQAESHKSRESLNSLNPTSDLSLSSANDERQPPVRKNGYGGFGEPASSGNGARGMARAETFPRSTNPRDMSSRSPSDLGPQPDMYRRPSAPLARSGSGDIGRKSSLGPDTSRPPPPRPRRSLIPPNADTSSIANKEWGPENPCHTPQDSMSSGYSSVSEGSNLPVSGSPERLVQRNKSEPASRPRQLQQPPKADNSTQPRRENARPELLIDPAIQAPQRGFGRVEESPYPYSASPLDDRHDPAIQAGIDSGSRGGRYGTSPTQGRDGIYTSSRGDCKACGKPITGRSISSADGRLTGKYHKECFVCTAPDCRKVFSSAEFYVYRDRPYCKFDYHKLNNTLCRSCNEGIEGRYAEDESRVKYHVDCFCCSECRVSLADGYFEVDGRAYCERDALRLVERTVSVLVSPMPVEVNYDGRSGQLPPKVPPKSSSGGRGGQAGRGVGAGMERGPYGVAPANYGRLNKRMTYIGVI